MSLAEEQGRHLNASYYKGLISAETGEQNKLIKKRDELQKSLDSAIANGTITEKSEEWYQMVNAINDTKNAIDESTLALAQYNNQMRQLKWDAFDRGMESVKRLNDEADFYLSMIANEKMTDEDGNFTQYGKTSLSLHNVNYEDYIAQADAYAREYQEVMKTCDLADEKVIQQLRKLETAEWDARLAAEGEKQAIIDLIREGYEAQLEALSKLIQKYKDLKQGEKDAYEYQKTIEEKTKNIAALQKQLSAYGDNDTEEAKAKIQKLKVELEEAQQDLEETEYDKYLSDMNDMLDDLYTGYEEFIDEKLNDTNALLEGIKGLIGDPNGVLDTLNKLTAGVAEDGSITVTLKKAITGDTDAKEHTNETIDKEKKDTNSTTPSTTPPETSQTPPATQSANISSNIDRNMNSQAHAAAIAEARAELQRDAVKKYIKTNATDAKKKRSEYSDLNKAIFDNKAGLYSGKGKVLENKEKLKGLANAVGVKYDNADKNGNIYKKLKDLGIKGYAHGSKHIEEDQLALTQEDGQELIYRASDGSVLTPLGEGDMVFTNEMSKRLWELSKNPELVREKLGLPDLTPKLPATPTFTPVNNNTMGDVNINMGDVILPDVTNSKEFVESVEGIMRNAVCKNGKTMNCLTEGVSSRLIGKGVGHALLYH